MNAPQTANKTARGSTIFGPFIPEDEESPALPNEHNIDCELRHMELKACYDATTRDLSKLKNTISQIQDTMQKLTSDNIKLKAEV